MIEINFNPRAHALLISGHANAAPEGQDVVCAGISTLVHTLHESLSQIKDRLVTFDCKVGEGESVIRVIPKEEYVGTVELIFWTVLNGITLIAEKCPEYVKFEVLDPMDTASKRGEK